MLTQNRITRALSAVLCLCLVCACLVVPASAAEVQTAEDSWYNALDYYYPVSSNVYSFTGAGTLSYDSYETRMLRQIDITVSTIGNALTGCYLVSGSTETKLEMINVGSGIYRFYGTVSRSSSSISLKFTNDGSSTTYIGIERFYVSAYRTSRFLWHGDLYVGGEFASSCATNLGTIGMWTGPGVGGPLTVSAVIDDWQKFDYIDIWFTLVNFKALDSIYVRFGTAYVPFSVVQWATGTLNDEIGLLVRIDLSGLDRSSSSPITMDCDTQLWADTDFTAILNAVNGYVVADLGNPILNAIKIMQNNVGAWLTTLGNNITSGLTTLGNNITSALTTVRTSIVSAVNSVQTAVANGFATANDHLYELRQSIHTHTEELKEKLDILISGNDTGQDAADDFQDSVDDMQTGMDSDQDIIDSVTRPDVDDVDTNLDSIVGSDGATDMLSALASNEIVAAQFLILVTVMLISYVLFGKR